MKIPKPSQNRQGKSGRLLRRPRHHNDAATVAEYCSAACKLHRRDALGITDLPAPTPHTDQVKIDFIEGSARVVGPMTKEEKVECDWLIGRKADFEEELRQLAEDREEATGPDEIQGIDHEIARTRRVLEILAQLAGA